MSEIHHLYQAMSFIHCKVVFFWYENTEMLENRTLTLTIDNYKCGSRAKDY